ncbi:solute carrier family 22 member 10-like [Amblyomma americanum]
MKNAAIPLEADGQYSRCHQYANPYKSNDTSTVPCTAWEYDEDQAATSMVSHWDLVCDRRFLRVVLVFLNVAGLTTAGIAAGSIADTVGRRPVLMGTTASLLASTTVLCLGRTFPVHAVAKFIASGSAAAQFIAAGIIYFEVTIHENRPLHVVIAGAVAVVISELWLTVMRHMTIHWALKQAVFLAPTFLSAAAFCVGVESPRWLVAKARFQKAEDVMLAAAETNLFPLYNTACLLDKLKGKACMSSLAITTDSPVVKQGLVMSAKALVFVGYIVLATFSLELFPTAVRAILNNIMCSRSKRSHVILLAANSGGG